MNLKIETHKQNALLRRTEITARLTYEKATPSAEELAKHLAQGLKAERELLVVKHLYPHYGSKEATVLVYQYTDKDSLQRIECPPKKKEEKHG